MPKGIKGFQKGQKFTEEHKAKLVKAFTGRKVAESTKKKMSLLHTGKGHPMFGKKHSLETKEKMRKTRLGKSPWNKGLGTKTPESKKIRQSTQYKLWRKCVFERDNYTCIWCGERGGELNADHIKPFSLFPELRFAIDNGRTLCRACHKTTDTFGSRIFSYRDNQLQN